MQKALDIGREENNQSTRYLYLLDDSTRSAWVIPQSEALAAMGKDLAKVFHVAHFNLSKPGQWNQAIISLKPDSNLVRSQFDNAFDALVRGYGGESDATLQWRLDEQTLPGGGRSNPT